LSQIIKRPTYIIPLATAAGIADIWSVGFGITKEVVKSETAMNFLLFSFPVADKGIYPIIGVTDFIFAGMFLSLSQRFNLAVQRTRILIATAIVLSIAVGVLGGVGVPVLPVMGLLFILGHYQTIKIVDPREKKEAAQGILIIIAALAFISLIK